MESSHYLFKIFKINIILNIQIQSYFSIIAIGFKKLKFHGNLNLKLVQEYRVKICCADKYNKFYWKMNDCIDFNLINQYHNINEIK